MGLFGPDETFAVSFSGKFGDAALARLATNHGDRIGSLYLMDTSVTDDGLRHLKRFGNLHHLILASMSPVRANGKRLMPITDAGMAHLDLPNLVSLNLYGLPITDAGLKLLPDLPFLNMLQLTGTKVEGSRPEPARCISQSCKPSSQWLSRHGRRAQPSRGGTRAWWSSRSMEFR